MYIILSLPVATALLCIVLRQKRIVEYTHVLFSVLLAAAGFVFCARVVREGTVSVWGGFFYADALSAFYLGIILLVNLFVAFYTVGYIRNEIAAGHIPERKQPRYYALLNLFIFTMVFVCLAGNLGALWIGIEATTLASAFLVGIYNKDVSIEAAWKYIIICTVGITFALFGTVLLYYASLQVTGDVKHSLHWIDIARMAEKLNPQVVKIAFIFILIGYGTKAGLAPMHTWMPDAHSQAPSPVSALLSGVLLKCALYGIIRYHIIVKKCVGGAYSDNLFITFGIISLLFATFFILVQSDIKRLFAYSSLEHIGIIAVGIGFGGAAGLFGALLHTLNHALTKTLMFCTAGDIIARYRSRSILRIAGVAAAAPLAGTALLAGGFALAGSPPFSIFISELMILKAGFTGGNIIAAVITLAALVLIFVGLIKHISGMAFGRPPADVADVKNRWSVPVLVILGIMITVMGFYIPSFVSKTIEQCIAVINGAV